MRRLGLASFYSTPTENASDVCILNSCDVLNDGRSVPIDPRPNFAFACVIGFGVAAVTYEKCSFSITRTTSFKSFFCTNNCCISIVLSVDFLYCFLCFYLIF